MNLVDFYFFTASRAAVESALVSAGLLNAETKSPFEGVAFDFIGALVATPATFDHTSFPPVELTPVVMLPGDRANLRLSGPAAEPRAAALAVMTWPEGVTLLAAFDVPDAQRLRWGDAGFPYAPPAATVEETPTATSDPAAPTLAEQKTAALAALAKRRWEVETGGLIVSGIHVLTDRESQAQLASALIWTSQNEGATVRWKAADGSFSTLDATTIAALADAIGTHVQASFAREAEISAAITAAADESALAALTAQIPAFWP